MRGSGTLANLQIEYSLPDDFDPQVFRALGQPEATLQFPVCRLFIGSFDVAIWLFEP
jgi:hypothetical protein